MATLPPLGAHVSAAGGAVAALGRGVALRATALQIFVKSPSQWRGRALDAVAVAAFRAARAGTPVGPIAAHAAYLINLAAPDEVLRLRSCEALGDELDRCAALGLEALVVHPGAHGGLGVDAGLERLAASLDAVLGPRPDCPTRLLLENTAGAGTIVGRSVAELARALELARSGPRVGICLDTCHAFAAGYRVDSEAGWEALYAELVERCGNERLALLHLNDSRGECGSRRDRHANIGEGRIGTGLFARLLADARLAAVPMILETPLGDDEGGHARDLARLRELAGVS